MITELAEKALDKVRPPKAAAVKKVAPDVKKRVESGLDALAYKVLARRKQNIEFARNNHFVSIAKDGKQLDQQDTVSRKFGGKKDDHRVRRSHDILAPVLKGKTSAVTQRIPTYEVLEGSSDPEDYSASRQSENVLRGGYELWGVREAFRKAAWLAFVTEEAFVMPHFDTSVGPYVQDPETGVWIGMGEIRYAVYSGLEVVWEDGVPFEESPWWAIVHARARSVVEAEEGFIGGELKPDARDSANFDKSSGSKGADLVMVTDYLERPSAKHPNGRRIIFANDRIIFPEADYPLCNEKGEVVDEPCLRRIYYTLDGGSERARGLVTSLIEVVRDFDLAANKAVEFLQMVLVPQLMGPEGALLTELDDEPGLYVEVKEEAWQEGMKPEWREMPSMPGEFASERDRAQALLGYIANENLVPNQVEAAKAIGALAQKDALAWQDFVEDVAACYAACARDSLVLAQRFYTDQRMIQFRGRTGWESLDDFRGADIRGQVDVKVKASSLEPLTRPVIEQRIMNIVGMFPNYFPPEIVIAALSSGDFDRLNESFEDDEAQVNFIINQIRAGTFWDLPPRAPLPGEEAPMLDPTTRQPIPGPDGRPVMLEQLPGWMPRPFDGIPVWKRRLETFMKSDEWRNLNPPTQRATTLVYQAVLQIEAKKAAEAAVIQNRTAMQLGSENAAKPQGPKAMPSLPAPANAEAPA